MIFLTLGTNEPFDRLVMAMDNIAAVNRQIAIVGQLSTSSAKPRNFNVIGYLSPQDYYRYFDSASLIVSHAGMGTIISALERGKPIIVMPRKAALGENNSDHQIATAKKLADLKYVNVANDENELLQLIEKFLTNRIEIAPRIGMNASSSLLTDIRMEIDLDIR